MDSKTNKEIHKNLYLEIRDTFGESVVGVWSLFYIEGINKFRTLESYIPYIEHLKDEVKQESILNRIKDTSIDESFGSTGYAYNFLRNNISINFYYLKNTYEDPRGTVIELDYFVNNKHTIFIPVRQADNVVCGLVMIMLKNRIRFSEEYFHSIYRKYNLTFLLLIEKFMYIRQQSVFQEDITTEHNNIKQFERSLLNKAVRAFNNYHAVPYLYLLTNKSQKPNWIAFSKLLYSKIENELKFCSHLVEPEEVTCHFKQADCCGNNKFLKTFFFNVVEILKRKKIKVSLKDSNYYITLYGNDLEEEETVVPFEIENPFKEGTLPFIKYNNEKVTSYFLDHIKAEKWVTGIVYKESDNAPLIDTSDCFRTKDYSSLISPSNYLQFYYSKVFNKRIFATKYPPIVPHQNMNNSFSSSQRKRDHIILVFFHEEAFQELLNLSLTKNELNDINELLKVYLSENDELKKYVHPSYEIIIGGIDENIAKRELFQPFMEYLLKDYRIFRELQRTKLHATRSAISQAMLRNVAHNLGSHVLPHLTDYEPLKPDNIQEFLNSLFCYYKHGDDSNIFEKEIAVFNRYLKNRLDFLSEITFQVANFQSSISLKQVFQQLVENRIVISFISGVDDFRYEIIFKYNDKDIEGTDLNVAFPSDILGVQALYNIIEAKIRNSAKYGSIIKSPTQQPVTFTVNFMDIDGSERRFFKVELSDNLGNATDELVKKINGKIKAPVIDIESNKLRNHSLGVLEMQTCAAFLRQLDISMVDSPDYYPDERQDSDRREYDDFPLLEAFLTDDKSLGYRFYCLIPKEFLFVGAFNTDNNSLLRFGIDILSTCDFTDKLSAGHRFPHQFVLYDNDAAAHLIKINDSSITLSQVFNADRSETNVCTLLPLLPVRMLNVDDIKQKLGSILCSDPFTMKNFSNLENIIWRKWLAKVINVKENELENKISFDDKPSNKATLQIVLLNHTTGFQDYKGDFKTASRDGFQYFIEPLSSNARNKLPGWNGNIDTYKCSLQQTNNYNEENTVLKFNDVLKLYNITMNFTSNRSIENYLYQTKSDSNGKLLNTLKAKYKLIKQENELYFTTNGLKLAESFYNSVLVMDERVQASASGTFVNTEITEIFDCINCSVPRKGELDLSARLLDKDGFIRYISTHLESHSFTFMIIHYGLLERIYDTGENRSTLIINTLKEWCKKTRVIVTSGRGKHSLQLPDEVCYMNLSPLSNAFVENRIKHAINYLLNNARR